MEKGHNLDCRYAMKKPSWWAKKANISKQLEEWKGHEVERREPQGKKY